MDFSGFNPLSEKHGFIAVYPQAIDRHWNDGRKSEKFLDHDAKINDVAWIETLIANLKGRYAVDARRIYAVGISNGGMFTQRLAIELGRHFAAVASLTAQIPEPLAGAKPATAVSVLLINGTRDPFVPYEGGNVIPQLFPRLAQVRKPVDRGRVISTDRTIAFWIEQNGTHAKGVVTPLLDRDKTDGCTAERIEWRNPKLNLSVVLYKVIGGGHTWPGGQQYLPVRTIGETCRDFNASETIWDFFSRHPK